MNGAHTSSVSVSADRASHWVKYNHQERMPKRWIAFDTEAQSTHHEQTETQTWQMGAGIRWRSDLKTGDHAETSTFASAKDLWGWVTDFCRPQTRTVCYAHNLGYDVRISDALSLLPSFGWTLEWCNLDSNVSSMTWRSSNGTLVLADTWTWLPVPLHDIGLSIGHPKLAMPPDNANHYRWERYCMRDAEIVYRVVKDLNAYIVAEHLGNWQPTGAGMAYATWRHKFMTHKVLVHDDVDALTAERAAMHTGRAEAWRHGRQEPGIWTEVDMRNAYVTIASECDLPAKVKMRVGAISDAQYGRLASSYRVLALCSISTNSPVVPYNTGSRTIWPVGRFNTWLWDTEINQALLAGSEVRIRAAYCYSRAPILQAWAQWVLRVLRDDDMDAQPVVRTWLKHCSRALIGRIALRYPSWQHYGENPMGITGITREVDVRTGKVRRMLHIGNDTFAEADRVEGRDSLPQVTGWIMAECRARLWTALSVAGEEHVAHTDTDSLLVDAAGLTRLRGHYGADWERLWAVKGSTARLTVYGPRNYRMGDRRKASGVPKAATELLPNVFTGERWHGLSFDLEAGRSHAVTIDTGRWELNVNDPRRLDAPGGRGRTVPVQLASASVSAVSSSASSGSGE